MARRDTCPTELVPGDGSPISEMAAHALHLRIADKRLDDDPTNPWRPSSPHHHPRELAIGKLRQCAVSDNTIRASLKLAHQRGLPIEHIAEIAVRTGLADED